MPAETAAVSLSVTNCQVKMTSSAVKGWPSLHLTSLRSFQVTPLPSAERPPFSLEGRTEARCGFRTAGPCHQRTLTMPPPPRFPAGAAEPAADGAAEAGAGVPAGAA